MSAHTWTCALTVFIYHSAKHFRVLPRELLL
jgi:hypothetical protein